MRWIRPTRLPILIAWMAILGGLAWFGTHPRLVAPFFSQLISRQLMHAGGGSVRVTDFRIRPFEGMDLYDVSLSLPGAGRGMTLVSADTVLVDFSLGEILGSSPRVRRLYVDRPEVYSRIVGSEPDETEEDGGNSFPAVAIDQLEIRRAFLEFSGPDGRLVERLSHVDWNGSLRSGEDGLHLALHDCDVAWDTHESLLTELRGEVRIDTEELAVPRAYGLFNGNSVSVEGFRRWDGLLDIAVSGEGVSIPEVENLIDLTIGFYARGDLDATFFARGDTVVYEGLFNGELEGYQMRELTGKAVITEGKVVASGLRGRVNGASFEGRGEFLVPDEEHVSFVLEGNVEDADLSAGLVPEAEDLPRTDGRGFLRIEHTLLPEWTRVSGYLEDGFIEILPFDSCNVDVVAMPDSVILNDIDLKYGPLRVIVSGDTDRDEIFRGALSATTSDLSRLPPDWKVPPLTGWGAAEGDLLGPLDSMDFAGRATGGTLTLAGGGARSLRADLLIENVLEDAQVTAEASGRGLTYGGVEFGRFHVAGEASAWAARIDSFVSVRGDTTVDFSLRADISDTLLRFGIDRFGISLEGTRWAMVDSTRFEIGPDLFSLPGLRIESEQGELTARGHWERDGLLGGDLNLRGFDLGLLDPFIENSEPLRGRVTAGLTLGGEPDAPVIVATGDLVDAPFPLARVDSLYMVASYSRGAVAFEDLDLRTEYGRVRGRGEVAHPGAGVKDFWVGAELDAELEVVEGDWSFMEQFELPALDRLAGRFSGTATVGGTTDDPLVSGQVHSAPLHIHWLHLDEVTGTVWADRSSLVLGDLAGRKDDLTATGRIEVPIDLDFLHVPVSPPLGPLYMQFEIPPGSNMEPLSRATNAFIQTSGTGSGSVVISGPLQHPLYQGQVRVRDAGFVLRDMEEVYRDVSAVGVFEGDELRISNIRGKEGLRGTIAGSGRLEFEGLLLRAFDLRLDLDRFLLATVPDLRVLVSGRDVRLGSVHAGPDSLLVPRFSGRLEVIRGRYTGTFKEKPGAADPRAATVAPDWLANLELHGDARTVRILNREMELYLGGDLDLVRDLEGLYLRGALNVNAGRLIVFNNTFNVERGLLDFSREVGFDPRIDLDAVTKYRLQSQFSNNSVIENISVHVGATLANPEVSFTSDQGYSEEAIQRMLLGLDPYPEVTGGEMAALRASSITAGFNVLEREIARELNVVDTFEIEQIRRENEAGGTGLDPLFGVGKYIGSDLYLKFAQGVRQEDRDILVEYQINNRLLLQSEIRRRIDENQGQETYNLDLKYRFEY